MAKILVADDSLTIQKVIGITLASSGHELVECLNDTDLFRFIQKDKFDLVLLDFNLSDKQSGYDLAKQIKLIHPNTPIMIMLGTFDTVDESLLLASGIVDRVVKPFESGKFIKKCKDIIENTIVQSDSVVLDTLENEFVDEKANLWIVDAPDMPIENIIEEPVHVENNVSKLDPLASELAGWSSDKDIDLEEKYNKIFPEVIEEVQKVNVLERFQESSKFFLESEGKDENDKTELSDVTQPVFEIPLDLNQQLISEINDDFSPDAFWAVDDIISIDLEETKDIKETHLNESIRTQNKTQSVSPEPAPVVASVAINQDEIVEKLKQSLMPVIEEMVKQYCKQSAEKIAWEVIPDLAENLIRKELKEISDSIQ